MFFYFTRRNGLCLKSFQNGVIVWSPSRTECTLNSNIGVCEDDIIALDLTIVRFVGNNYISNRN